MNTRSITRTSAVTQTSHYVDSTHPVPGTIPDTILVNHVLYATRDDLPSSPLPLAPRLKRLKLQPSLANVVARFVDKVYYRPNVSELGPVATERGRKRLSAMLKSVPQGTVYRKGQRTVAALVLLNDYLHPFLKIQTSHVAFWGYERNAIDAEEAKSIKDDWLRCLRDADVGHLSMQVATFNQGSLRLAESVGFDTVAFRVEKFGAA